MRDPVNTARETRARYQYQDECVALRCIHNMLSLAISAVIVEWSSDYLAILPNNEIELVSIKHREPHLPAWTWGTIIDPLVDLHRYWRSTGERCTCVFASNIGVSAKVTKATATDVAAKLNIDVAEAHRFWQALALPSQATVLPRRSDITAVAIQDMAAVLDHYDRDPRYAEHSYHAVVARITAASIDEPKTPEERVARLTGSMAAILDRTDPDIDAQTLHLADLRDLALAVHDEHARRPAAPIVVPAVQQPTEEWRGGHEIEAVGASFIVHDPVNVERAPEGSYLCQRAKARQFQPAHRDAFLIEVTVHSDSAIANELLDALRREADLLEELSTVDGMPRVLGLETSKPKRATLVTDYKGQSIADTFGAPGRPYPGVVLDALLRGLRPLCDTLDALHRRGFAHRALSPEALLVTPTGTVVLRDLGLAMREAVPDESVAVYRAPEQLRPLITPPGPKTDVYQLAAIVHHLSTGRLPDERATNAALNPDPALRLDIKQFKARLYSVVQR